MPDLREQCIEVIVATLHYEGKELPEEVKFELDALRAELTESSFSNRLRRHAGMKLVEDHFNTDGEYSDIAGPELIQLAADAVANPDQLAPEVTWLVTDEAKNGFEFGQLLGQADDFRLWPVILSAWVKAGEQRSNFFIGGYLSICHLKNRDLWEQIVEDLLANAEVRHSALGVVWRSGMSDRISNTLLALAKQGDIDPKAFRLFIYGGIVRQLPLNVFEGIIDLLLENDDPNAPDTAMEILESRLRGHGDEVRILSTRIEQVLNLSVFVEGAANKHLNNMLLSHWNRMASRLLDFDPDAGAKLAARCIENFANVNSVTDGFRPEPLNFLSKAAKAKPTIVWPAIARRLELQEKEIGTWHLLQWFRGGRPRRVTEESGLNAIPAPVVFNWIDIDVGNRAWILAEYCAPFISKPDEPATFARRMLERYGSIEQVRRSLHANNFTETWGGPTSEHYRRKLAAVNAHLEIETNDNVRIWLMEHREQLELRIEREVERELRESEY